MFKCTQRSFAGGLLDRRLMGRQDLEAYFKGASVLRNFLVRRQGCLSKRRGTDEAADLSGLLGQDADGKDIAVGKARLFPLAYDRKEGYHLLVTAGRAFLCSRRGVRAVTYKWLDRICGYDGTADYADRASVSSEWAYTVGDDGYDTAAEAFDAAKDGDVVRLTGSAPHVLEDVLEISTKGTVTLDLNGRTLESVVSSFASGTGAVRVTGAETTLVIDDTAGGGALVQPEAVPVDLIALRTAGARLVVKGGSVIARAADSSSGFRSAIHCNGAVKVEVSGGVVANEWKADGGGWTAILRASSASGATCAITGGLLRGPDGLAWKEVALFGADAKGRWDVGNCHILGGCICASAAYLQYNTSTNKSTPHADPHADYFFWAGVRSAQDAAYGGRTSGPAWLGLSTAAHTSIRYNFGELAFALDDDTQEIQPTNLGNIENFTSSGTYLTVSRTVTVAPTGQTSVLWRSAMTKPLPSWDFSDERWNGAASGGGGEDDEGGDERPYYVAVPWADAELDEVNFCQSGDTLFFAHRNHPPGKIVFSPSSRTLAYSRLDFSASAWLPPAILAPDVSQMNQTTQTCSTTTKTVTSWKISGGKGVKTTTATSADGKTTQSVNSNLSVRTVKYCVAYVKDGVESPPSAEVSASYVLPWPEGDKITVCFWRGGNAAEADEYRIYKKQGTEFGLIGTVANGAARSFDPVFVGRDASVGGGAVALSASPRGSFTPLGGAAAAFAAPESEEVKGRAPGAFCEAWGETRTGAGGGTFVLYPGCGGTVVPAEGYARFNFGQYTNVSLATATLWVDGHAARYEEQDGGTVRLYDDITVSGTRIRCLARYRARNGGSLKDTTFTVTLGAVTYVPENGAARSATRGTVAHHAGDLAADAGRAAAVEAVGARAPRKAVFDLTSLASYQIEYLSFWAEDAQGRVPLVVAGAEFEGANTLGKSTSDKPVTFADTYITPDMSLTPVDPSHPFSGSGNYPACVGIHQQRLVFASTRNDPAAVRMSATGDLYDFSPHRSLREDDPISFTLAATEFPDVNHLVVTRDIILLAEGGEWKVAPVSGNTLSFKTVSASLQGRSGSTRKVKPMTIGDEVVFADASGMALLATRYNYASDGYETTDLTVLCADLFDANALVQADYEQFPDSRVKCVLADGRAAVMAYMPEHSVTAWSECVLGGGAAALGVSCSRALAGNTCDTVYLVRQGGALRLWAVRPDLPGLTVAAQVCMDGVRVLSGADAAEAWREGWTAVDAATAAVVTSPAALDAGASYLCGFAFEAEFATVRPEVPQNGTIQFEIKNAKDAEVRVLEGGEWRAAAFGLADDPVYAQKCGRAPTAAGGALVLETADRRLLLSGANSGDGRVQVKSSDPWPLSVLSVSVNYEIQPLSNSEG